MELNVTQTGTTGTPLVLLHGFPLDERIWDDVRSRFGDRRVITVDLPGFGRSAGDSVWSIGGMFAFIHDELSDRGVLPCILGGLSMGGYVAQHFIRQARADVKGLLLIDTKSAADDENQRNGRDAMIQLVLTGGATAVADQMLPKVLGETSQKTRPEVAARARKIMESQSSVGIESALIAMRNRPDYTADLQEVNVPMLIVVGEQDTIAPPSIAHGMAARMRTAQVAVIAGAGHFTPLETPVEFSDAVNRWMDENGI